MSRAVREQAKAQIGASVYGRPLSAELYRHITVIIKTFERPLCVARLIGSICHHWGNIPILVCDDSREPLFEHKSQPLPNLQWLTLDFDKGHTLGAGRNYLVDQAQSRYVFLCDDDHEITARTRLESMYLFLEQYHYDLVAGAQGRKEYGAANFEWQKGRIIQRFHQHYGLVAPGVVACDRVSNTFLARREALRRVRWQEQVYAHEHADFFIRAKKAGLKVAQMGKTWVEHERNCEPKSGWLGTLLGRFLAHRDGFYRKLRMGAAEDESELAAQKRARQLYKKYVLDAHGVEAIVDDYNKQREQALFRLIGYPDEA